MYTEEDIKGIVEKQRAFFRSGATLPLDFRIRQLKALRRAVISSEKEIEAALREDLGRTELEAYFCDIGPVIMEINETLRGLRRWARPETHFSGLTCFPSLFTKVYKMPYGVTLIISPFNFPFMLSFGVLLAAIGWQTMRINLKLNSSPASVPGALNVTSLFLVPPKMKLRPRMRKR